MGDISCAVLWHNCFDNIQISSDKKVYDRHLKLMLIQQIYSTVQTGTDIIMFYPFIKNRKRFIEIISAIQKSIAGADFRCVVPSGLQMSNFEFETIKLKRYLREQHYEQFRQLETDSCITQECVNWMRYNSQRLIICNGSNEAETDIIEDLLEKHDEIRIIHPSIIKSTVYIKGKQK